MEKTTVKFDKNDVIAIRQMIKDEVDRTILPVIRNMVKHEIHEIMLRILAD